MILQADARNIPLADGSVHMCVTSPPYWGLRDYGLATWEGGDSECNHKREVRMFKDGCIGCGAAMEDRTSGCRWCADRHAKRRKHGTPDGRHYNEPPENHWDRDCSRDQVTQAGVPFKDVCAKCGAIRHDAGIGLEKTPEEYVANIVAVFREVWRVLRDDGTLWLNLGDCYASGQYRNGEAEGRHTLNGRMGYADNSVMAQRRSPVPPGLKPKDLVGIPWRVAFALQADGWYLRSDIIWHKPNPMPESVTDRPTKSHEYLFLLSKRPRYYYDAQAIAEPAVHRPGADGQFPRENEGPDVPGQGYRQHRKERESKVRGEFNGKTNALPGREAFRAITATRNRRDVWTLPTSPYKGAHFATFPPKLVEPCVLAGTSASGVCPECGAPWERVVEKETRGRRDYGSVDEHVDLNNGRAGDVSVRTTGWRPTCDHGGEPVPAVVLDPFCGSGTVGAVARKHGRRFVGLDLSWKYLRELAYERAESGQDGMGL